jgi:hypothetical protein
MNSSYHPSHMYRWILPLASCVPVLVGIIGTYTVTGPPDQGAGAAMVLAFILFPVSFLLALISAGIARARREAWSKADRVIGYAPLCLLLALVLVVVVSVFLGH